MKISKLAMNTRVVWLSPENLISRMLNKCNIESFIIFLRDS